MNKAIIRVLNFLERKEYNAESIDFDLTEGVITFTINHIEIKLDAFDTDELALACLNDGRKCSHQINKAIWEVLNKTDWISPLTLDDNLGYVVIALESMNPPEKITRIV